MHHFTMDDITILSIYSLKLCASSSPCSRELSEVALQVKYDITDNKYTVALSILTSLNDCIINWDMLQEIETLIVFFIELFLDGRQ